MASKTKKVRSVRVDLTIDCTRCMRPVTLEAIAPEVRCRACLHVIAIDPARWAYLAASEVKDALGNGEEGRATDFADVYTVVKRVVAAAPVCPGCGVVIEIDALAATTDAHLCACGAHLPVRAADEAVRAIHGRAIAVVGERTRESAAAVEPVAFRCGRCGGGLRTDGAARAIPCAGCAVEVDVPEALWEALHPVAARAPVYLLIGGGR